MLADQVGREKESFVGESLGQITKDNKFSLFVDKLFKSKKKKVEELLHVEVKNYNKFFYVIGKKNKCGDTATIIGLDVTELKQLEEEQKFDSQLRTLGEITSHIVHEISNPLSAIAMMNDQNMFTVEDLDDTDDYEELREKIIKNHDRIKQMIRTISLIIDGTKKMSKKDNSKEKVDILLLDLISQVKLISSVKAKKNKIDVEFINNCSEDRKVKGNFVNLLQVFVNLISNSIDAIEEKEDKWIKLVLSDKDERLKVEVVDSGTGIEESIAENMFNPFFSSKPIGKGNGIGLDVCKKIVEEHEGKIYLDQGKTNTTFTVEI